jgi:hypothetical protein
MASQTKEKPVSEDKLIAYCPINEVEAYYYPFYIKKGKSVESDQLLLDIHFLHLTSDERLHMGPVIEINSEEELLAQGFTKNDKGVYIVE